MCKQSLYKVKPKSRIDLCLRNLIYVLNETGTKTVACCCGHGKYPMSIVARTRLGKHIEIMSMTVIPRTRNFYKSDGNGGWFIPECLPSKNITSF